MTEAEGCCGERVRYGCITRRVVAAVVSYAIWRKSMLIHQLFPNELKRVGSLIS